MAKTEKVAILGASDKKDRYAYKAFEMLKEYGHTPIPVSPKVKVIEGIAVVPTLSEIKTPIDTLTMYVNPMISSKMQDEIMKLHQKRVIFNPGSENPKLAQALEKSETNVLEACTLVMLRTGQY